MSRNFKVVQIATPILLPPHQSKCQECASDHAPHEPHNAHSLFYAVKFKMEHGRDPDWRDAIAHCAPELQAFWKMELATYGIDVDAGQVRPPVAYRAAEKKKCDA